MYSEGSWQFCWRSVILILGVELTAETTASNCWSNYMDIFVVDFFVLNLGCSVEDLSEFLSEFYIFGVSQMAVGCWLDVSQMSV